MSLKHPDRETLYLYYSGFSNKSDCDISDQMNEGVLRSRVSYQSRSPWSSSGYPRNLAGRSWFRRCRERHIPPVFFDGSQLAGPSLGGKRFSIFCRHHLHSIANFAGITRKYRGRPNSRLMTSGIMPTSIRDVFLFNPPSSGHDIWGCICIASSGLGGQKGSLVS